MNLRIKKKKKKERKKKKKAQWTYYVTNVMNNIPFCFM